MLKYFDSKSLKIFRDNPQWFLRRNLQRFLRSSKISVENLINVGRNKIYVEILKPLGRNAQRLRISNFSIKISNILVEITNIFVEIPNT